MHDKKLTFDSSKAREYFLKEISFNASPYELHEKIKDCIEDLNIIDVRKYDDYIDGHIPFAIHVPFDSLEEHIVMFEKDKLNVVYSYCPYCKMASKAAYTLADKGYPVVVLKGGYKIWCKIGYDTVKTSDN
ncbi:hypothetical protein IJ425_07840 [bacterium]|nr:hypothetical protein [bacterium]